MAEDRTAEILGAYGFREAGIAGFRKRSGV